MSYHNHTCNKGPVFCPTSQTPRWKALHADALPIFYFLRVTDAEVPRTQHKPKRDNSSKRKAFRNSWAAACIAPAAHCSLLVKLHVPRMLQCVLGVFFSCRVIEDRDSVLLDELDRNSRPKSNCHGQHEHCIVNSLSEVRSLVRTFCTRVIARQKQYSR